jgi:uncharacterized membrane protein
MKITFMGMPWHLYLIAFYCFFSGCKHFWKPELYTKVIPSYVSNKMFINEIFGLLEIMFAFYLCIPIFSNLAAIAIMALLISVFLVNIKMFINKKNTDLSKWILFKGLILQFILMVWTYQYTDLTNVKFITF